MLVRRIFGVLLCGIALSGGLVPTSEASSKACSGLTINSFVNIAAIQGPNGALAYQFRLVVTTDEAVSAGLYFRGTAANDNYDYYFRGGQQTFTRWLGSNPSGKGNSESVYIRSDCAKNPKEVTAKLYKPWDARPLIKPWEIGCTDYVVIDSRGSGEPRNVISGATVAFVQALHREPFALGNGNLSIMTLANPYPAVDGIKNMLGALLKVPFSAYRSSVGKGERWLKKELEDLQSYCSGTRVFLAGYSQGAQVTGDVYQRGFYANVAGVLLFGDTRFNPNDSSAIAYTQSGLFGALGLRPAFNDTKVRSYCHVGDSVCAYGGLKSLPPKLHNMYALLDEPLAAATYFGAMIESQD